MPIAKIARMFGVVVTIVAVLSSALAAEDANDSQSEVLFRKAFGEGEIVCTAGPNLPPSLLAGVWGEAATECVAAYEFRVDWHLSGHDPVRLWSMMVGIPKRLLAEGRIHEIGPDSPKSKLRIAVMDVVLAPGKPSPPGWPKLPGSMVLAIRSAVGSGMVLRQVSAFEGEATVWRPNPAAWTGYDTPTTGDPRSVSLSVSPDGLCRAEVVSMRRHTIYRQVAGKWDFEIERQWEEDAVRR